jgi:uncharacterized membrane protein SirB2
MNALLAFYPQIKAVHVLAVLLSGSLFALRGAAVIGGAHWPLRTPVRVTSIAIDTALLTAALMLFGMLPKAMFANGWLAVKLVLVVVYVALGSLALRRAHTHRGRVIAYVAALLVLATIIGIARAHHPLGWWRGTVEVPYEVRSRPKADTRLPE